MADHVPFQRWKIFWWTMKMAIASGHNREDNPELARVYYELAEMGNQALKACEEGQQDAFIEKIESLNGQSVMKQFSNDDLERMLDGTHEDVPEWLRKDRK